LQCNGISVIEAYMVPLPISETNHIIYRTNSPTTVEYAKTTTQEQDEKETSISTNIRVYNIQHKTNITLPPSGYQKWTGYPDSPVLSEDFQYQFISTYNSSTWLSVAVSPFCINGWALKTFGTWRLYRLENGEYSFIAEQVNTNVFNDYSLATIYESNNDIYWNYEFSATYFAKTTTLEQDGIESSISSLVRDKGQYWKNTVNNGGYQKWSGYPDSPVLTSDALYQFVYQRDITIWGSDGSFLVISSNPMYYYQFENIRTYPGGYSLFIYPLINGSWGNFRSDYNVSVEYSFIRELNTNIYTSNLFTTVATAKTTTPVQDSGISTNINRINI